MQVIDFHIHPFLTDGENACKYPAGPTTPEEFRADMERAGVQAFCGSVIGREFDGSSFDCIRRWNDDALALRGRLGGVYVPGIHIHPGFVKESCEELERMHDMGVRLVGELVPYMMGWKEDYSGEHVLEILELAQTLGMVISFHTQDFAAIERMVREFPRLPFVAAHPQEYDGYMQHLALMARYDNYHLDLSGTGLFRYGMLHYGINKAGRDRFLFGSDFPVCNPRMNLYGVLYEKLTDDELDAVLHGNARRLLSL